MKVKCTNIEYDVTVEDAACEIDRDDYALESDYLAACEAKVDEIFDSLPYEVGVEVDEFDEEEIANAISDMTGFLIKGFTAEVVD